MSAIGRLRFAFLSSAFIDVAIIHPSYANADATTAAKIPDGPLPEPAFSHVPKASAVLPFIIPATVPTSAITAIGTSLITVVLT